MASVDHTEPLNDGEADFLLHHPHIALQLALGVTDLRGLRCLRRGLAHEVDRLQRRACRSRYYARDNARRPRRAEGPLSRPFHAAQSTRCRDTMQ